MPNTKLFLGTENFIFVIICLSRIKLGNNYLKNYSSLQYGISIFEGKFSWMVLPRVLVASQSISMDLVSCLWSLSWWSRRPKKRPSKPIWAKMAACSREWPNGSICHATLGRPHSPKVSFKFLFERD